MAIKTSFNAIVPTSLPKRINTGSVDISNLAVGFLVTGTSAGGTDILKPVSKKQFVAENEERFESKSQAVKAYYNNLRLFTRAAQADFNADITSGRQISVLKNTKGGRKTYTTFEPKAAEANAGASARASKLEQENTSLKARLAKLEAMVASMSEAND